MSGLTKAEIYFKLHKHALSDGDPALALGFAEKALKEDETNFEYALAILNARLAQKKPPHVTVVMKDLERAFLCDPTRRETYDFAVPLMFQNKMPELESWLERALIAFPDDESFLNFAGVVAMSSGDARKARRYFQQCLAINPTKSEHHFNCGITYTQDLDFLDDLEDKSIWHFQMALCYKPDWPAAKQSLVGALTRQAKFKEALMIDSQGDVVIDALQLEARWRSGDLSNIDYDEVISRVTDDKGVLGSILKNQTGYFEAIGDYEKAEKAFRHMYDNREEYFVKDSFMYKDVALGTGHFLVKIGNWEEGAPKICESIITKHDHGYPMWDGEETDHLVILNKGLGNGDQMFYARYIPLAAKKAKKVTVVVAPRLKHMFANLGPEYEVTTEIPKEATCWIECSYLIKFYGPREFWDFVPVPKEPPTAPTGKGLLHLASSKINPLLNYRRDVPFDLAKPLLDLPDLTWISVAKQDGEHPNLKDLSDGIDKGPNAFEDTMKLLMEVDVVVTCDTFMAHLAGLMKRPTVLVLTTMAEFRWGSKVYEYHWYPTVTYLRQKNWGEWTEAQELVEAVKTTITSSQRPLA